MGAASRYVVGFDPSTTLFGVACGGERDAAPKSFVWKLPGAQDHVFDLTLKQASESTTQLLIASGATDVFIEAPIIVSDSSTHTMVSLIQLVGAVRAAAVRGGCRVHLVATSTVRKHFIGIGNMKTKEAKRAVIARCQLLGWPVEDNDSADACAVWCYGISLLCPKWAPRATPLFAGAGR